MADAVFLGRVKCAIRMVLFEGISLNAAAKVSELDRKTLRRYIEQFGNLSASELIIEEWTVHIFKRIFCSNTPSFYSIDGFQRFPVVQAKRHQHNDIFART